MRISACMICTFLSIWFQKWAHEYVIFLVVWHQCIRSAAERYASRYLIFLVCFSCISFYDNIFFLSCSSFRLNVLLYFLLLKFLSFFLSLVDAEEVGRYHLIVIDPPWENKSVERCRVKKQAKHAASTTTTATPAPALVTICTRMPRTLS